MNYDVFISYRRDGGSEMARLLYDRLHRYRISAFLDVEEMRSGTFNTQLYDRIDECKKFLLVLPPHALDRCAEPQDWVRLEVEHALEKGKTIIPIMLRDFVFPQELPESMRALPTYEGVAASHDYFDATMERIVRLIIDSPENVLSQIPEIAMEKIRCFSAGGMENTVFRMENVSACTVKIYVNFEPTRIRKEIPAYAGVYFSMDPVFRGKQENALVFTASSPDRRILQLKVEIKPEGRGWMHECFLLELSDTPKEFCIPFARFSNPYTFECIEEVTFVLESQHFADENCLTGTLVLDSVRFQ